MKGSRVTFAAGAALSVTDGPFAETKELVAGYWMWQVKDMDEALELGQADAPFHPTGGQPDGVVELRPVFEAEDFGEEFTPELREQEERLRSQIGGA